jgi:hypothetical protein
MIMPDPIMEKSLLRQAARVIPFMMCGHPGPVPRCVDGGGGAMPVKARRKKLKGWQKGKRKK